MPNSNTPFGFKPVKNLSNEPYNGGFSSYKIASGYATNIFAGDVVKLLTTGYINLAGVNDQMRGVAVGFRWINAAGAPVVNPYWPASTVTKGAQDAEIYVIDDPNIVFEAAFGNSTSVPAIADIGASFQNFTGAAGGNTSSGNSAMGLDYSTVNTTLQQWRMLSFVTRPDNDLTSAYSRAWVTPLKHDFLTQSAI